MAGNDCCHHLLIEEPEEQLASSQENRLSLHHSFYNEEDKIFNMQEFKETALAAYEQAIQLAPYEATLHYYKGHLLEQLGRSNEAVTAYDEAQRLGYQRTKAPSALVNAQQGHARTQRIG